MQEVGGGVKVEFGSIDDYVDGGGGDANVWDLDLEG